MKVLAFPDLRIILMSATIDISMFVEYFSNPVIIEVEGRTYPVTQYFLEDFVETTGYQDYNIRKKSKVSNVVALRDVVKQFAMYKRIYL